MGKISKVRLLIQAAFTALSNGYVKGFAHGKIYQGDLKYVCVPGMNCYSCPGALGSCPIGALQSTLSSREYKISLYVFGLISLFGVIFGRFICGFLCPFGLIQDLLFKIPFVKKVRKLKGEKFLRGIRFLILAVFVIILPMFVIDINAKNNTVILGDNEDLFQHNLIAKDVNFISIPDIKEPIRVKAKVRYAAKPADATVYKVGEDKIKIVFDEAQRAITKGQSVVMYDGDKVVGGGIIESSF